MNSLALMQEDFLARILAEDAGPDDRAEGFAIYRNNYRSSLVEAPLNTALAWSENWRISGWGPTSMNTVGSVVQAV